MSKPGKDKPKVDLACVASRYDAFDERTIQFSHPNGGGLITFKAMPDGTLRVGIHDQDPGVVVVGADRSILHRIVRRQS